MSSHSAIEQSVQKSAYVSRRDVALHSAASGITMCGDMIANSAVLLHVHAVEPGEWPVTVLLAGNALLMVATAPLSGRMTDAIDSRRLLTGASLLAAVCCAGVMSASGFVELAAAVAVLNVMSGLNLTALNALLPVLAGKGRIVRAASRQRTAILLGGGIGFAAGGTLFGQYGLDLAMTVDAVSFLAFGACCTALHGRRGGRPARESCGERRTDSPDPARPSAGPRSQMSPLGFGGVLWLLVVGSAAVGLFVSSTHLTQVFFLKDQLGLDDTGYGLVSACWMVGMVAAAPLMGRVPERVPVLATVMVMCEMATGAAIGLCGLLATVPAAVLCYVVAGCASSALLVTRGALMHVLTPEERRGRVVATGASLRGLSMVAALLLGTALNETLGPGNAFVAAGVGSTLVSLTCGLRLWNLTRPPADSPGRVGQAAA